MRRLILGTVIDNSLGGDVRATIIATDFTDGVMVKNTAQAEEKPAKASAQQPVQQAAPKRDSFTLEPPSFMRQQSEPAKPASNGAFAFPAFRLTPDDKDQK